VLRRPEQEIRIGDERKRPLAQAKVDCINIQRTGHAAPEPAAPDPAVPKPAVPNPAVPAYNSRNGRKLDMSVTFVSHAVAAAFGKGSSHAMNPRARPEGGGRSSLDLASIWPPSFCAAGCCPIVMQPQRESNHFRQDIYARIVLAALRNNLSTTSLKTKFCSLLYG
jgi:hypothetical protein